MKRNVKIILCLVLFISLSIAKSLSSGVDSSKVKGDNTEQPNFIIFFVDNLGYGDIGPFGSELHRTPNLDRMAEEGTKFTHFYSTSGVCTPSRSSLMTGSYPRRVNLHAPDGRVLFPVAPVGLHPDEITIATLLKDVGYTSAIIGKWHLGDQDPFLPTNHGFDYYFGIPYSDDMTTSHQRNIDRGGPELPLMRNKEVIEAPVDRDYLTQRETGEAIKFLEENKNQPFLLYLPQAMPGSTREPFASPAFKGKSKNGAWGDSVEELDWSAGEIIDAVKRLNLDERTIIIWTSDNGAPIRGEPFEGSNAPLGGSGYTTGEGGQRVPMIARWPGVIPAGETNNELTSTMDLFVTFGKMAGAEIPQDRIIDGKNIIDLLLGKPEAKSPYEAFFYYDGPQLQAVRSGPWKLYLPLENKIYRNEPQEAQLYNVETNPGESDNVIDQHSEIVKKIKELADKARQDLGDGDGEIDHEGTGQRPIGRVENPTPRLPACCAN